MMAFPHSDIVVDISNPSFNNSVIHCACFISDNVDGLSVYLCGSDLWYLSLLHKYHVVQCTERKGSKSILKLTVY